MCYSDIQPINYRKFSKEEKTISLYSRLISYVSYLSNKATMYFLSTVYTVKAFDNSLSSIVSWYKIMLFNTYWKVLKFWIVRNRTQDHSIWVTTPPVLNTSISYIFIIFKICHDLKHNIVIQLDIQKNSWFSKKYFNKL